MIWGCNFHSVRKNKPKHTHIHRFPLAVASRVQVGELFRFSPQLIKPEIVVNKEFKYFSTQQTALISLKSSCFRITDGLAEAQAEHADWGLGKGVPSCQKVGRAYHRTVLYISIHSNCL